MRTKQQSSQCRVPRASLLLTLTTIILFSCSQRSLAQQRDGDATNADSNSSHTAPNRSAVNFNFNFANLTLLNGEFLEVFGANNSRGILRGHPTIPGTELGTTTADPLIFSTNGVERMRILENGFIGIGTNTPGVALDVGQNKAIRVGTANLSSGHGRVHLSNHAWYNGSGWQFDGTPGALYMINGQQHVWWTHNGVNSFTQLMWLSESGNLGIGTFSPTSRLHVNGGSIRLAATAGEVPFQLYSYANSDSLWLTSGNPSKSEIHLSPAYNTDYDRSIALQYIPGTTGGVGGILNVGQIIKNSAAWTHGATALYTNGAERLRINSAGNVGIGTTAPAHKLDVFGAIRSISGGFVFPDGTVQTTAGGGGSWTSSGTNINNTNTGNVGIGTANPAWGRLQVNKTIRIDDDSGSPTGSDTLGGSSGLYLGTTTGGAHFQFNGGGGLDLWQHNNGWGRTVTFTKTGNLGVGTPNPTEKLEVMGNIKVSGNIAAKYQDVAEWVDSSQELVAGTVVVLDSSRSNHVIAATQSYDSRIAGVISLQPGLTLGEEAEGRVLVATTGRVRVKVDATEGAIQIGDLLVTSNREGFAMKSLPVDVGGVRMHRPSTLIGKALEPLTSGTGQILVLLSLQ